MPGCVRDSGNRELSVVLIVICKTRTGRRDQCAPARVEDVPFGPRLLQHSGEIVGDVVQVIVSTCSYLLLIAVAESVVEKLTRDTADHRHCQAIGPIVSERRIAGGAASEARLPFAS